ncbi:MAG: HAD family hydrolase [Candidatus Dojkabacteria bacterium]
MAQGLEKIKLIIWDWYNTLSKTHLYQDLKYSSPAAYEQVQKFFQEGDKRLALWMRGELSYKQIHAHFSGITGLDRSVFDNSLSAMSGKYDVDERILPYIRKVKGIGIKQVIATDNFDIWDEFFLPQYSQYISELFDGNYNSAKFRIMKADEGGKLLKTIMEEFKVLPTQTLLIDDNIQVTEMFEELGGNTISHEGIDDLKRKLALLI